MIDIKPYAAEKLKDIASVELSFHDGLRTLPVIVMSETGGSAVETIGNSERVSSYIMQLDVYAETMSQAEELAAQVASAMTAAGFRRTFSESLYDEYAMRKCMRFSCGVDEVSGRILSV